MSSLKSNCLLYVFWIAFSLFLVDLSFYLNMHAVVMARGYGYMAVLLFVVLASLALVASYWRSVKISAGRAMLCLLFSIIVTWLFFAKPLLYTPDGLWLTGAQLPVFGLMTILVGIYVLLSLCLLYTSPSPRDGLLSRM